MTGIPTAVKVQSMPFLPYIFAFDLDGTVTTRELLPLMAEAAGLDAEIARLTAMTLRGDIPFAASFRQRFSMLAHVPLRRMRDIAAAVPLDPFIVDFIAKNRHCCVLVTGNLDCWIAPLVERLGCPCLSSRSCMRKGKLALESILDKGDAVRTLRQRARHIVAIGESVGDIPMFLAADLGIAYAGVHSPVPGVLGLAGHVARDGEELCGILQNIMAGFSEAVLPLDAAPGLA